MPTKQFFQKIRREYSEIQHLREAIEYKQAALLPRAIQYDRDHVQVSPFDMLSETVAAVTDQMEILGRMLAKLERRRAEALTLIEKLENTEEREVMRLYYLDLKNGKPRTWEEVAEAMGYDKRTIYRFHGEALIHIKDQNCH